MVQRKVANNKHLGIKTNNSLITQKKQVHTKPIPQNHETKTKGADLKAIKMKKSRSIKRSDCEINQRLLSESHEVPRQPGKPPPVVTPNPKKPSPCKSSDTSPNYMKSTSSSEARKEKTTKISSVLSTSKIQKVAKILAKTSSLKKVRTLTKAPSFKHTRTTTCSSTLKNSKFPPYLELDPGATEAEGKSVLRVCSYNHCSLNGHHHNSAPPLKRFVSLKRRQLKSQKLNRPEVLSPRKRKHFESKTGGVANTTEDFFVEIFVQDKEVATQVSESLSDGPCSEIDFPYSLDQNDDAASSEMNYISGGYTLSSEQNQTSFGSDLDVDSSPSVTSSEFLCENSDIEWEEGQTYASGDNVEILTESHCNDDQGKSEFETENSFGGYLEEFYLYPPYFQDEIVEYVCFSDADSLADSEFTQPGKDIIEGPVTDEKDVIASALNNEVPEENNTPAIEETIHDGKLDCESDVKQEEVSSKLLEEATKSQNEDLESYKGSLEIDGDGPDEDKYMAGEIIEENAADHANEEREPIEETINIPLISENSGTFTVKRETYKGSNDGPIKSSEVKLHSHEDNVVEENSSEMGENNNTEEVDATPGTRDKLQEPIKCNSNSGESYSNQDLPESCNKSRTVMRRRKEEKDAEAEREFNPRGPNFLDIEPDPEAEKVDLRHQEMDYRKNAEEWMLDYALQKTVNQLAPARKKKVALLVQAFEAVIPPK